MTFGAYRRTYVSSNLSQQCMTEGRLLKCAIRIYDSKGQFQHESEVEIEDGAFGENPFELKGSMSVE